MSENLAIIEGYLGRDPKLTFTPDGTPVCKMSVGTTEEWTDKESGEKKSKTTWHTVEVWRNRAKACTDHLKEGSRVYVRGKMTNTVWEPVEGKKAKKTVITAQTVSFL
jgi:single-strand DNA-binding protein